MMEKIGRHGGGGSGKANASAPVGDSTAIATSGSGSKGTSYSGGTGGANATARTHSLYTTERVTGSNGKENGGAGGDGIGAGNPPGGTGGLLIIYTESFNNKKSITSKGSNATGGGSGGGSINIFYKQLINEGTIDAKGGTGSGNGGDGCVTLRDIDVLQDNSIKTIYINSESGDDTTGDGTKDNPYKTLDKIAETGIIELGPSYDIQLSNGTYELTTKMFELNCNNKVNIYGNKQDTILNVGTIYGNNSGGGNSSREYELNIYRLIWNATAFGPNPITIKTNMNIYNVVFKISRDVSYLNYLEPVSSANIIIKNCISTEKCLYLRTDTGNIPIRNSYGSFGWKNDSSGANKDYENCYFTLTPSIDSTTYQITENEEIWKNVGVNADGTQTNLGVYGGEYSWDK